MTQPVSSTGPFYKPPRYAGYFLIFNFEKIIDSQDVAKEMYRTVPCTLPPVFSMEHLASLVQYQNQELVLGAVHEAHSDFTTFICACVWCYANLSHV